jgi:hypothetical protein
VNYDLKIRVLSNLAYVAVAVVVFIMLGGQSSISSLEYAALSPFILGFLWFILLSIFVDSEQNHPLLAVLSGGVVSFIYAVFVFIGLLLTPYPILLRLTPVIYVILCVGTSLIVLRLRGIQ